MSISNINNKNSLDNLQRIKNVDTTMIFTPKDGGYTYSHHPFITFFKGKYYAMWSNGRQDEDEIGQIILLSTSKDLINWSEPIKLFYEFTPEMQQWAWTSSGFYIYNGTMVVYGGYYSYETVVIKDGLLCRGSFEHNETGQYYRTSTDGINFSEPVNMNIPVVPNYPPQPLNSGRLMMSANFTFPISDNKSGTGQFEVNGLTPNWAEYYDDSNGHSKATEHIGIDVNLCEGSFYQKDDDEINMLLRSWFNKLYVTKSIDDGKTWSLPQETEFSDCRSKFHCGRLPDGRFYIVSTPVPNSNRTPLCISLSTDGINFDKAYIIADKHYEQKCLGQHKGGIYGYPHTIIDDNEMIIICSITKERILVLKYSLDELL